MTAFGAYVGNDTGHLGTLEGWLSRPVDQVLTFLDQSSWGAFDLSIPYVTGLWHGTGRSVEYSVPLTVNGTSLETVATGADDAHFTAAARAIAASQTGTGPIYIRLGWEFNGDWMPWAAAGHEGAFIQAYHHAVDAFRSVSDRFQIVWDENVGGGNMADPSKAYPGDKYVDVIGADIYYNTQWDSTDPQAAFANTVSRDGGLQWQQDFAAAHGKPTAISEWGVQSDGAGPFVQDMKGWFDQHHMVYANYWDANEGNFPGRIDSGQYPDAAASFRDAFGAASTAARTLTLQVSEDTYQGDAQFVVTVDGAQVGGIQTAHAAHAAGQHDTITLSGNFAADPSRVEVRFLNDAWGGSASTDRNLYVEHLTIAGHDYAGSDAVSNTAGASLNGTAVMGSNGTATFDTSGTAKSGTLVLQVAADSYQGDPQFVVTVDGKQVGGVQATSASHAAGQSDTITLHGDFGSNPGSVAVQFLNDAWGGSADRDRNLYVEHVTLNGHEWSGAAASSNTAGANVGGAAVLGQNGTATYLASAPDTLTLKVAADSYQGDPQFIVRVDGQQVGAVQTAHASHAAGQSDTFTFSGNFGAHPSEVSVQFLNDAWGGSAATDRNLYVEGVTLDGHAYDAASAHATNPAGDVAGGVAEMFREGTATFHLFA